jgi:hypothetical protein
MQPACLKHSGSSSFLFLFGTTGSKNLVQDPFRKAEPKKKKNASGGTRDDIWLFPLSLKRSHSRFPKSQQLLTLQQQQQQSLSIPSKLGQARVKTQHGPLIMVQAHQKPLSKHSYPNKDF